MFFPILTIWALWESQHKKTPTLNVLVIEFKYNEKHFHFNINCNNDHQKKMFAQCFQFRIDSNQKRAF